MKARAVDWLLFMFVTFEFISGLGSFLVGRPEGRAIFWIHTVVGLAALLLVVWKFRRVRVRVTEPRRWQLSTTVSVLTGIAVLLTIGSGVVWAIFQRPLGYPNGMILHTGSAIALLILMLWHQLLRFKPLRKRDLVGRRSALSFLSLFAFGGIAWGSQEAATQALGTEGAERRFTGSRNAGKGTGNGSFPVTIWMFDRPEPIEVEGWKLSLTGFTDPHRGDTDPHRAIREILSWTRDELRALPQSSLEATIDCTGGWYSTQSWGGIRVAELFAGHEIREGARWVSFVSVTGYRWNLPIDEAMDALLATHVGGEPLNHWHGAPLRLVAPGRRGFQWVKWIHEVQLLERPDIGQWGEIFVSGLRPNR